MRTNLQVIYYQLLVIVNAVKVYVFCDGFSNRNRTVRFFYLIPEILFCIIIMRINFKTAVRIIGMVKKWKALNMIPVKM